ncbi:MAG: hypothetical protein N3D85_06815 [Candidatus Bathyarchaeota archaeon]|nr:hypothetical protein [Candidatus Bathyarchaeota archaeon]
MLRNDTGRLIVYASHISASKQRLQSVRLATEKMAHQLKLDFEIIPQQRRCPQIYVYYEHGKEEPIPLYCDEGKTGNLQEIATQLRNMMYVLSFHPRHSALAQLRNSIMKLS